MPYTVLSTVNGVEIRNGGFGSSACAHSTKAGEFYAMTDRGSNTINSALNFKIRSLLHDKNDEFQKLCYDHFQ